MPSKANSSAPICRSRNARLGSRSQSQQRFPQPDVLLQQMQVTHLIGSRFGVNNVEQVPFLVSRPRSQFRNQGRNHCEIVEGAVECLTLASSNGCTKHSLHLPGSSLLESFDVPGELCRHSTIHAQADVARRKLIPSSRFTARKLVKSRSFRQTPQRSCGGA